VPHHGSKGSKLKVQSHIRIISVGAHNSFGHPHSSTLPALRTDQLGAITVTLAAEGPRVASALTNSCPPCKLTSLGGH
jgi:beta-lactamase superfamily II metal-dependent hydrolase